MMHQDLQELVPLLAINAVGSEEEMELRSHLESCNSCQSLYEEHRETAGLIGLAAPASRIGTDGVESLLDAAKANLPIVRAPIRRRLTVRVAGIAAAFTILAMATFSFSLSRRLDREEALQAEHSRALALSTESGTTAILLHSLDSSRPIAGTLFVSGDGRRTAVIASGLDKLSGGIYTLWSFDKGIPRSEGDFLPDRGGVAVVYIGRPLDLEFGVAITLEPKAGNKKPAGKTVLTGSV